MADILADQYAKVFSKPKQPQLQPNQDKTKIVKIDEVYITEDSIVKAINELSPSSSAGPDGFPAMLLKKCKDELSLPLCLLCCTHLACDKNFRESIEKSYCKSHEQQ